MQATLKVFKSPVSTGMFSKIRQSVLGHEISELVQLDLAMVEREIGVESVASIEAITTINQYLQAGGGKRLRPVLLLLTTRLFGPATDTARRLAAVVEMIHTATLVHDDVIDVARNAPRPALDQCGLGQSYVRPRGRLALHAGVSTRTARTQFSYSRYADFALPR